MKGSRYSMSYTTGGLFLSESVQMAASFLRSGDWQRAIDEASSSAAFSSPKPKSMQRAGREVANRLANLDQDQLVFLVETSSRPDRAALLWLAICRTYRIIREFAVEIVSERYDALQLQLPVERYNSFVHDKGESDEWLAARTASTIERSRQVLFKIMREVGVIDGQNQICRLAVSASLRQLLQRSPDELGIFPGGLRGAI